MLALAQAIVLQIGRDYRTEKKGRGTHTHTVKTLKKYKSPTGEGGKKEADLFHDPWLAGMAAWERNSCPVPSEWRQSTQKQAEAEAAKSGKY